MTSIIKLHVISGGADGETPQCYILQVDELRLLLDAGMEINSNSVNFLKEIKKYGKMFILHYKTVLTS